jgi:hypothetical protein
LPELANQLSQASTEKGPQGIHHLYGRTTSIIHRRCVRVRKHTTAWRTFFRLSGLPFTDFSLEPQSSADQLNFVNIPLPFKSPDWIHRRATTKPARRTLKQLLVAERERAGGARISSTSVVPSEKNSRRGTPVGGAGKTKQPSRGKNARFLSKAVKEELAREAAEAAAREEEEDVKASENGDEEDPLLVRDEDGNVRKREIITCERSFPTSLTGTG